MTEETLFHEAQVRTPVERAAFLDANCADPEMRLRVEGLLKAHDAGGAMGRLVITGVYTPEPGATEDQPAQTEQAGERIGSYKLLQKLGEGGMGAVWVAEQSEPVKRRVAVKLIKAGMDSTQVLRRFEAERQALALMDHQHIAKVLDAGTTPQGRPYFAMELIKGIPITKYCDEEHLTPRERLELFIPVCHAVQHAHQKGVIHRDLKPSNVLIALYDGKPVPKVIDFGVAKATSQKLTEGTMYTEVGQIVGTLEYMAPEQAELNNLDIDTRADIYSLGVILYELLAGSPPFTSKQLRGAAFAEMLRMIREVEPPKPSTRISSSDELPSIAANRKLEPNRLTRLVHGDLDWIVMKALEKDRARRYETANGFAMDVQHYLANEPVSAGKPSALHRLRKFARRNQGPVIAASLIFAALVVGVVGTTGGLFEARRQESMARNETEQKKEALRNEEVQRKLAVEAKEFADGARKKAVAEQQRAESLVREASRSDFATAQARLAGGKWQEGMAYLERSLRYDSENTNARDAFWLAALYGVRDDGRMPRFELRHELSAYFSCFSPDGTLIVTASSDDTVRIWNAETGQPVGQPIGPLGHEIPAKDCSFSPDGRRIVTAAYKTARVWDVKTGQPVGEPLRHEGVGVQHASFSPDGSRIVTASFDKTARIWEAETARPVGEPLRHEDHVNHASFSPDGTRIATASSDKTARVWEAETGQPVGEPLRHEEGVQHASFSPNGTRIVTASWDRTARVWDAKTGQPVGEPLRHEGPVIQSSFSPDGTRIVTASSNGNARVWDAETGQPVGDRLRHESWVKQASFSPDGTQIVTASIDGNARVWDAETGQPVGEPLRHVDGVTRASFISDGTRIVTESFDKTVRIWEAETVQRVGAPLAHEQWVTQASFSPDGSRIVTASVDQTARIWDAETSQPVGAPLRHADTVHRASFSPDGRRIVTASQDSTARLWDAETGQPLGEPLRHKLSVRCASFSPDGRRIVTASDDYTAQVWDAETGQLIGEPLRHKLSVRRASFSPDGRRIVTASDDYTAQVWDAETGQLIGEPLRHKLSVRCASFSPDGRRIVTASDDYTARIWDAETGQPVGEPLGHELEIHDASFSPDGTRIVTASNDKTARVWDARTGRPVGEPLRHELHEYVYQATFSADGTRIVTADHWATARIWDAETGQPLGEAFRHQGAVVGASFSPDSRRIVTASDDGIARVWEWKPTRKLDDFLLSRLARFLIGAILDPGTGTLKPVSREERLELWKDLEPALADSPEWLFLARTVFPRSPDSPIAPRGMMTIRDAATRLICKRQERFLDEARSIDPRHPLIQIALARPEGKTPARAEFLREYGTSRLPDDAAVCREAAKMLVEQKDKLRAARALDKATKLDPKHPDLIRLREALEAK